MNDQTENDDWMMYPGCERLENIKTPATDRSVLCDDFSGSVKPVLVFGHEVVTAASSRGLEKKLRYWATKCRVTLAENRKEIEEWKGKYHKLNEELMCELRDPNGTIWEHAKKLQDECDELREAAKARTSYKELIAEIKEQNNGIHN